MSDKLALSILALNLLVLAVMFVSSRDLFVVESRDIYLMVIPVPVFLPLTLDFSNALAAAYGLLNATATESIVRGYALATQVYFLHRRQIG